MNGALVTRSTALKYFGDENAVGKTLSINTEHSFQITAVIEDLPANTHFNSMPVYGVDFELVLPMASMPTSKF